MTIIATPKVYERFVEDHEIRLKEIIQKENVTFMILNDKGNAIGPSMTLTDVFTYIYFFNTDGVYDNKIIVSTEDSTRSWAKELYKYYKKQSTALDREI
ncbi:transcriptional regulator FilR1 domain-containing protein [Methanimicrococcus hongohii]|nr:transcriptional regulator FilR1 domain-containing protein [Methanimicrococcus sp. Hf6]